MKLTIIGTGTSTGIPEVGCVCAVCRSTNPKDKRLRSAAFLDTDNGERILMDCGPDFRQQMLPYPLHRIDGILITHEHYDHVGGIDDLRPFCRFGDIPIFAEKYTATHLRERIPYCFAEHKYPGVPKITLQHIAPHEPFCIGKTEVMPLRVMHGKLPILGYRIGDLGYVTDMKWMPFDDLARLQGVKCLVINALRFTEHPTHQSVSEALEAIAQIAPREAYLIHMSHHVGLHSEIEKNLPPHVHFAYDGMEITI